MSFGEPRKLMKFVVLDRTIDRENPLYVGLDDQFNLVGDVRQVHPSYAFQFGINDEGPFVRLKRGIYGAFVYLTVFERNHLEVVKVLPDDFAEPLSVINDNNRWLRSKIRVLGREPVFDVNLCYEGSTNFARVSWNSGAGNPTDHGGVQ